MNAFLKPLVLLLAISCPAAWAGDIFDPRVFVWTEYVALHPDLSAYGQEAAARDHWRDYGSHEGRSGNNSGFNVKRYCEANPDLLYHGYCRNYHSALIHYVDHGYNEGRPLAPLHRVQGTKVGVLYSPWNAAAAALYRNLGGSIGLSMERLLRDGSLHGLRAALLGKSGDTGLDAYRCGPNADAGADAEGQAARLFCGFRNFVVQSFSDSLETDQMLQGGAAGRPTVPCIYRAPAENKPIDFPSVDFNDDANQSVTEASDEALKESMSCPSEFGSQGADAYVDAILESHARQLRELGADFIIVDASNGRHAHRQSWWWEFGPAIRLLDVWSRLAAAQPAAPPPKVAFFFPTSDGESNATWINWKTILEWAPYDGLLLKDTDGACGDPPAATCTKRVIFASAMLPLGYLSSFDDASYLKAKMKAHHEFRITSPSDWGAPGFEDNAYFRGVLGFISPCVAQARDAGGPAFTTYTTSMLSFTSGVGYEPTHCNQPWSVGGPLGSAVAASPSYQIGVASAPFEAAGHMRGLTLRRQFQSILNSDHKPRYVIVSGWNETIAQMGVSTDTWRSGATHRSLSMGLEDDTASTVKLLHPGANAAAGHVNGTALFVDAYGKEFSRALEPTRDIGPGSTMTVVRDARLRELATACVAALRNGRCNFTPNAGNECCPEGAAEDAFVNVYAFSRPDNPEVRAVIAAEGASMTSWTEVPTTMPQNSSPDPNKPAFGFQTDFLNARLSSDGTYIGDVIDRSGPFIIFGAPKPGERDPLRRCRYFEYDRTYLQTAECPATEDRLLGYISKTRSSETPRALRTCGQGGFHRFAVGVGCPAGWVEDAVLGYVK